MGRAKEKGMVMGRWLKQYGWVAVLVMALWVVGYLPTHSRVVHASGLLSLPSTVVQTNQSNTYTTGTQDFTAAVHTVPTIVVANVGALPATGCVNGELAVVIAATLGQQIYENSVTGVCVWTQQLNSGSSSGGGVITYSGAGVALTGTLFFPAGGGGASSGTEGNVSLASSSAGTITNLSAQMSVAPGMGNTVTITWRKNGSSQSATCAISGAVTTECQDTTHSFNVSQGDLLDYQVVASGGVIAGTPNLSIMSQFGTTQSGGTVNAGTLGQCAYYAANGTAISAFTPSGDLGSTCPTPTVVNLSHVTNASLPNSGLVNASVTVNSTTCTLGSSCNPPGGTTPSTQGVYASAPSCVAGINGQSYITTDAGLIGYCNGTSFYWKYGLFKVVPPVLGDTSWLNQTSATITAVPAGVTLIGTGAGANNIQARVQAYPTPPFTQIACFDHAIPDVNFASAGMFFSDGVNISTSKLTTMAVGVSGTGSAGVIGPSPQVFVQRFTNVTTGTTNPAFFPLSLSGNPFCVAMQDDGTTNRKMAFSYDRQNWWVTLTEGRTTFLTPADIGYYVNTGSAGTAAGSPQIHLVSWELVASTLF